MSITTDSETAVVEAAPNQLYIGGEWRDASGGATLGVEDPSTGDTLVEVADATAADAVKAVTPAPYDRVLVDAPCSNSGVLARRPEAKFRFDVTHLTELAALQKQILAQAYDRVFPGGLLAYSTCSLEPEENEEQVRALLAAHADLELVEEKLTLPAQGAGDGGYFAIVKRKAAKIRE